MKKKPATPPHTAELRRQAEAKLSERKKKRAATSAKEADTRSLLHELQVYQIDLEMRNEELVQSRAEAKALLRQFADLYDFIPAGYFTLAPDGAIHLVNLAGANLLGVERGVLINRRFGVFVSARSRTTFSAFLDDVFTSGSKEVCEVQLLKDGSAPLWVHIEAIRGDGQREACHAVVVDITERKRAEEELGRSQKNFRIAAESVSDCVWEWNIVKGTLDWFGDIDTVLGYGKGEFPRTINAWEKAIHPDDHDPVMAALDRHLLTKEPYSEEYRVIKKDGSIAYWIDKGTARRDKNNKAYEMIGAVTDITERKRAEEELKEERILLRTLIDNLPDRIYVKDVQSRKIISNIADWQASGGKTMEDVIGKTDFDTYPPELAKDYWAFDKTVIDSGISIINREELGLDSQGNSVWVLSSKVPLRDGQGKVVGLVGIGRDITERKQMENDLRKSEEAQRFFSERLTNVLEAINDLSKSETFDDLCRNAAVSAKRLMNFDRVGIWFFLPDHRTMQGSFGTDENGNLQDERSMRLPIVERHIHELVPSKKPIILFTDEDLRDYQGNIVGKGSHVVAGLWNGEGIIGLLGADNLIRKHPITESDIKLLDLYAVSLGHLCTLKRAEDQIINDLKEKNIMLKEIHHRVKNNLNVISSLLSLQADQITNKSQALAAFEESKNRIYAMALVHENLYKEQDYSRINVKSFVETMMQNLLRIYHPSVKIDIRIQDLTLDLNNAVPCGLILNELVTNALKHAFKDNCKGLITIGFRVLNGNIYELTVQDNGVGLPKEIDVRKSKSLGLVIVNQLISQINGDLKITRGKGTQFQITFPVSEGT